MRELAGEGLLLLALKWHFNGTSTALQWRLKATSKELQWHFNGIKNQPFLGVADVDILLWYFINYIKFLYKNGGSNNVDCR